MKTAIVYSSRTGNTKQLADTIRAELSEENCIYFGTPGPEALEADRIYAGFWTDKGSCDEDSAAFLKQLTDQELFIFGTAGFGVSQDYFDKLIERAKKNLKKSVRVIGSFICQGKMPMSVRERYVKMQSGPIKPPNIQGMIDNFDLALSHPDENDLSQLRAALKALK